MGITNQKIVIIGAGLTGLSAACRLRELGHENFVVYEKNSYPGGLCASFTDEQGFTWDLGGHVLFSFMEHKQLSDLLVKTLGRDAVQHERKAWVRMADTWVPYPFQDNFVFLPKEMALACFHGLHASEGKKGKSDNFREWIADRLGAGIGKHFMFPYNEKLWQHDLADMNTSWIEDRIAPADATEIMARVRKGKYDFGWGPNSFFQYPRYGGIGMLAQRLAEQVKDRIVYDKEVGTIETQTNTLYFRDGEDDMYDMLISTAPLDAWEYSDLYDKQFAKALSKLTYTSVFVVGFGLEADRKPDRSWVYFPERDIPFYRVTYLSKYSAAMTPNPEKYRSLLCELSFDPDQEIVQENLVSKIIAGLIHSGLLKANDREAIVSTFTRELEYAYPIPTLGRDKTLHYIQQVLNEHSIYSCGRFGSWIYEKGNMDNCIRQGIETAGRIVGRKRE